MFAFFASLLGTLLESGVARFLATKVLLTGLFLFVLPVVLNNVIYSLMQIMINRVNALSPDSIVVTFSGLAGFLASHLQVPQGISILMSAVALRMSLKLISKVW